MLGVLYNRFNNEVVIIYDFHYILEEKMDGDERTAHHGVENVLIIAKTDCNTGHCYIGLDQNGNFVRPLSQIAVGKNKRACCWPLSVNFDVGTYVDFKYLRHLRNVKGTKYPHASEDFFVLSQYEEKGRCSNLYEIVRSQSSKEIGDIFHPFGLMQTDKTYHWYIKEGVPSKSAGALRIQRKFLKVHIMENRRPRLVVSEGQTRYFLPFTSMDKLDIASIPEEEEVLIVMGLARSYPINNEMWCMLLGFSIIRKSP